MVTVQLQLEFAQVISQAAAFVVAEAAVAAVARLSLHLLVCPWVTWVVCLVWELMQVHLVVYLALDQACLRLRLQLRLYQSVLVFVEPSQVPPWVVVVVVEVEVVGQEVAG